MLTRRNNQGKGVFWYLGLLAVAVAFAFQAAGSHAASVSPADRKAYLDALKDSQNATQSKVFNGLLAVTASSDAVNKKRLKGCDIIWEGMKGDSRILVAAFMDRQTYETYYKSNLEQHLPEYVLQKSLWVTVVPELQNYFVRSRSAGGSVPSYDRCPPTPKRILKLLGLHPAYSYDILLEMWADPKVLFRPSGDPEITDHESEITTVTAAGQYIFPADLNNFVKMDDAALYTEKSWVAGSSYRDWFVNRTETVYNVGNPDDPTTWGYPWTRLGYTYDWGNPRSHVGASEFVIRLNPAVDGGTVKVKLHRAIDTARPEWKQYFRCRPGCTDEADASAADLPDFLNN